jgi:glutaredoxin
MSAWLQRAGTGLLALAWLAACPDEPPAGKATDAPADGADREFAEITVSANNPDLLYTYLLADGSFATVDSIEEVPEQAREQVVVVDTSLSPEQRRSSQVIYVADLTAAREDGTYPYSLVSRYSFERDLRRAPGAEGGALPPECKALVASPPDRVVLYETSWCSVCKAAARYLRQREIPFVRKDVESDPQIQRELACKALAAGVEPKGVPVFDVAGELLLGFDRDRLAAAARRLNRTPAGPATPQP